MSTGADGKVESRVGQVLHETYRLERIIGEGGMGAVYEASHARLTRRFAVKVLDRSLTKEREAIARFRREAEITGGIGHPHIVEVIDFNHTPDGGFYMVMELLDGEDLATRLARVRRLPLERAAALFMQTASALEAAHRHNVVHRDLKPHNIFLCRRGQRDDFIKVVDFGISKVLGADSVLTRTHAIMGTPHYMAPEQIEDGAAEVDARADIYALASIVYEMLSGAPPFVAQTIPSLLFKVVYHEPVPLDSACPEVPASVSAVVARAMHKQRTARFASMADFWTAFAAAMRQEHLPVPETADDRQQLWGGDPAAPAPAAPAAETLAPYTQPGRRELDGAAAARLAARPTGPKIDRPTTLSASHGEIVLPPRGRRRFNVIVVSALALFGAGGGIIIATGLLRGPKAGDVGTGTGLASKAPDVRATLAARPPDAPRAAPDAAPVVKAPDAAASAPDTASAAVRPDHGVKARVVGVRKAQLCVQAEMVARISIDGRKTNETPFCVDVPLGVRRIVATVKGYEPLRRPLKITKDTSYRFEGFKKAQGRQ